MLRGFFSLCFILAAASAPKPTVRPLPFYYDLYTFRGGENETTVVASFAVPTGKLQTEDEGDGVQYRFDVTLVLADTALRSVYRTDDSVYVDVPRQLAGEHLLHTHVQLQAPPSTTTVQRVVMTDATKPGIGQLYTSPFVVPDYSGEELMLSDIALGRPDENGGWTRGGVTLALLPTSLFPEGSFDLYYEVYNLPTGHRYATQIAVEPLDDPDASSVRTSFLGESASSADGLLGELRRVEASLDEGRYRLTIMVTDQDTGRYATQARIFHVQGWGRGATMVPALPWRG